MIIIEYFIIIDWFSVFNTNLFTTMPSDPVYLINDGNTWVGTRLTDAMMTTESFDEYHIAIRHDNPRSDPVNK
jgi:hypothetical protein